MKRVIIIVGLAFSFQLLAQESTDPAWKNALRSLITSVAGEKWSHKILRNSGEGGQSSSVLMPEIPLQVKSSTDVESYTKKAKGPTEYDRLPAERKRQFDYNFIQELFRITRKTEARDEDLANWLNTLDQGGSREGIYQALVLDEVYAAMENMEERPSKGLVDFYVLNSRKYLNQSLKPESISSLNLYSLKRILTEKGLDLMEFYETKDLDSLYRWYANFSADLGKNQGPYLSSEIRRNPSAQYHYEWAKNMPIQHLKSEFIIKLHAAMNGLQTVQ